MNTSKKTKIRIIIIFLSYLVVRMHAEIEKYMYSFDFLDCGYNSAIVTGRVTEKLKKTKYSVTQWQIQACNPTNNQKIIIYLPYHILAQQKL